MDRNLRFKIDCASLIVGRKFTVFALFYFVCGAISKYKPLGRLYFVTNLGCLYLEGLIFAILRYNNSYK